MVILAVTVDAPDAYTPGDINDTVAFHLGTTELNSIEADISAVNITASYLLSMSPGIYVVCANCGSVTLSGTITYAADGPWGECCG